MFHKKVEIPEINPIEEELSTLTSENAELSKQFFDLGARIRASNLKTEKDDLTRQKGQVYKRMQEIQNRLDQIADAQAPAKTTNLLRANRENVILKNDSSRIKIPENLELSLNFSCGHNLKITLPELFKIQTHLQSNRQVLAFWERTITMHESHKKIFQCLECLKQRKERLKTFQVTTPKPIGTAQITLEVI